MRKMDGAMAREWVSEAYDHFRETGNLEQTARLFGFDPATLNALFRNIHDGEGRIERDLTIYVLEDTNVVIYDL